MIDFDDIEGWHAGLRAALSSIVPEATCSVIKQAKPQYVEDACSILFKQSGRNSVIDATLKWLRSSIIAGYHGTRLTDDEVLSVQAKGLLPLAANQRRERIVRALSSHPNWEAAAARIDAVLETHGPGAGAGRREGQVHLTPSRAGLANGFNHYLTHGSEFDQRVAHALLGASGEELLATDGRPRVLQFAVPGAEAIASAHPWFSVEDMLARGDVPNLVRPLLEAWSYQCAHPDFDPRSLEVDCGMIFRATIPASWIRTIDTLPD